MDSTEQEARNEVSHNTNDKGNGALQQDEQPILNNTSSKLMDTEEQVHPRMWHGNLSLIHPSEIICKILYDKFYPHAEVSIVLGDWKAVLYEQYQYASKRAERPQEPQEPQEPQVAHPRASVYGYHVDLESSYSNNTPPTLSSTSNNFTESATPTWPYSIEFDADPKLLSLPVGESSSSRALLDTPKMRWSNTQPAILPSMIPHRPLSPISQQHLSIHRGTSHAESEPKFVTSSKSGLISVLGTGLFECVVFPYFSSYNVPKKDAKILKSVFGKDIVDRIDTFIRDEYQGEQPPGSAFIIETNTLPCQFVVCVSMSREAAYFPQDYAYNSFRSALLAIHTFNKFNPEHQISKILCPVFDAPHVSPFTIVNQMATCYEYQLHWDWRNYPAGTLPPLTYEMRQDISAKINAKPPSGVAHVQAYMENLVASRMLESRGFVYESELAVLMSWIDGTALSPFPREELARLLIRIAKNPGLAPFTLTATHIYANITPAVLEYILDLCRRDQLKVVQDISPEELRWGDSLAQGTSGRVYKGEWRQQPVAIKKFLHSDPPLVRNELALISLLRHPNLVECFGGFAGEGSSLFVSELMDCNLFELLRVKTTLDFGTKIKLAIDIAEGVAFLHSRNIIHRDLKSVNVLIRLGATELSAKVCDFGLSRVLDSSAKMTGNVGTVAWIAPEVFQNKKYSEKYSFGVILYEMLTHITPFKDIASFRIPAAVVKGKRPTLPTDALHVPKAYLSLMKQCWHQNPAKRPSFTEILSILSALSPHTGASPPISYTLRMSTPIASMSDADSDSTDDTSHTGSRTSLYGTYQEMEDQLFPELKAKWIAKHGRYNKDPLITDAVLLKCLRARQHNIKQALESWYKYLNQGKRLLINLVRNNLEKKIVYVPCTLDTDDDPILVYNARDYFVEKFPVIEFIRTTVYCLEQLTESDAAQRRGVTVVANTSGWTMSNMSYKCITAFFDTFKSTFPIQLKRVLMVDPPSWLPKIVVLLAPVLGRLISKIFFVPKDELSRYVTTENLPPEFGGTNEFGI